MRKIEFSLVIILVLVISSCVLPPKYINYDYNTTGNLIPGDVVYFLPKDPQNPDLAFYDYQKYLSKAFEKNGIKITKDIDKADVLLAFNYNVSDPINNIEVNSIPQIGITGVKSSTTVGYISSNGLYSGTTFYQPQYGVVGSYTYSRNIKTYNRYLQIIGVSAQDTQQILFNTVIRSEGTSDDLRSVIPYMIMGSYKSIGKNTYIMIKEKVRYESSDFYNFYDLPVPKKVEQYENIYLGHHYLLYQYKPDEPYGISFQKFNRKMFGYSFGFGMNLVNLGKYEESYEELNNDNEVTDPIGKWVLTGDKLKKNIEISFGTNFPLTKNIYIDFGSGVNFAKYLYLGNHYYDIWDDPIQDYWGTEWVKQNKIEFNPFVGTAFILGPVILESDLVFDNLKNYTFRISGGFKMW